MAPKPQAAVGPLQAADEEAENLVKLRVGGHTVAMNLAETLRGAFLVLDGPDGAGKSTQLQKLREHLEAEGATVEVVIDPGGTTTGQKIRQLLLGKETDELSPVCETLLFMASRAQLVFEKVRPAQAAGKIVLGDRFISATLAYQGALGVDPKMILDLGQRAVDDTWPCLTVLLDLDAHDGIRRAVSNSDGDRMESRPMTYHEKVREQFHKLGSEIEYPTPVTHIDARGTIDEVHQRILTALRESLA